jgi:signal transduction histidine kinase
MRQDGYVRSRNAVPAVTAFAGLASIVAMAFAATGPDPASRILQDHVLAGAMAAVTFSVLGAVVLRRLPGHPVGRLCLVIGVSEAVSGLVGEYGRYAVLTRPGSLPAGAAVASLESWVWFPGFAAIVTLLVAWFPDGRVHRRWVLVPLVLAALGALAFVVATAPMAWRLRGPDLFAADRIDDGSSLASVADAGLFAFLAGAAGCVAAVVDRFRRADGRQRQQLLWFACGAALAVALLVLGSMDWSTAALAELIALPLLPAAVGVALLRHRLYDIEFVVNRIVLYSALTLVIGGLYVGLVAGATTWLGAGSLPAAAVASGIVAVAFDRLRRVLERVADRLLFARRHDPAGAMSELSRRLATATGPDVLDAVAGAVMAAVGLRGARVTLSADDAHGSLGGCAGDVVAPALALPLVFEGHRVGLLEVEERPGAPLDRSARTLLHDLAAQAAIAAQAVLLAAELQRSRARLLEAVEQERRRLRRDLHDGLGTSLVGVVMQLEAVSNLVNPASPAAALVKTIESEARQLVTDTRRLVHGLAPPVVEEVGLVEAIRLHADRLNRTGGRRGTFQLRADSGIDGLPAAVEIAAYIIATEAMTNVARHARASSCTVVVSQNSRLHIEVLDDGVGIGPAPRTGVGLNSMHERTDELGGALVIESVAPRGTRVAASLPLDLR